MKAVPQDRMKRRASDRPLVLCVDDQPLVLKLLCGHLETMGCRARSAAAADAALAEVGKETPALVLLDVSMPGMDGYELCERIHQVAPNLPVVFVTGLDGEADRARAFAVGAVDYLVKPIVADRLVATVEKHLRTARLWSEIATARDPALARASIPDFANVVGELARQIGIEPDDARLASLSLTDLYGACGALGLPSVDMARHLAEVAALPFISEVDAGDLALGVLPSPFCLAKFVLPLRDALGEVAFAVANPFDLELRDAIQRASGVGRAPRLFVTAPEAITRVFDGSSDADGPNASEAARLLVRRIEDDATPAATDIGELTTLASSAPIVKLVNEMLAVAIQQRASDVHVEPRESCVGVRYRIDGRLEERSSAPKHLHAAVTARIKIMARMDIAQRHAPQDGRIRVSLAGGDVNLRVSTMPCRRGENVVVRILDARPPPLTFDALGFDAQSRDLLGAALEHPRGLVLVTGPSGSGKAMTLCTAAQALNSPEHNVVTVEESVEFELDRATQVEVAAGPGVTFAPALRAVLRQDPDIIVISEIRDAETLDVALRASLKGHLVLSTLHALDASSTVAQLHDMAPPYLVASALHVVVAQRLLRRLCPHCKSASTGGAPADAAGGRIFEAVGCAQCRHTGYHGRVPVVEVLTMTDRLRDIVRRPFDVDALRAEASRNGMRRLRDAALDVARAGETSLREVECVVGAAT